MDNEKNLYNFVYQQLGLNQIFPGSLISVSDEAVESIRPDLIKLVTGWHSSPKSKNYDAEKKIFIRNHEYSFSRDSKIREEQEAFFDGLLKSAEYNIQKHKQGR